MAGVSEVFNLDFKFGGNAEFLSRLEKLLERVDARFESTSEDISDATDDIKEMADAVDDLNDSFKDGVGSLNTFGEKLKDIAQYYLSFLAIRSGAERVWSFGMQSMDAYSTQERAENQLKGVMKNRGTLDQFQTIKDYAAQIQGRSIYGDEALIKGAGELATYVKGTESLKSMMDLLTDYAAGMTGGGEVSPEQMESLATGLGMAYDGNYMAMRRKGFDTSKLEALDAIVENGGKWGKKERKKYGDVLDKEILNAIKKEGGVTEQMRVEALKESLGDWQGLADTVNSLDSSALIRFNNKMGDLREEIGKKIYPAFNQLVDSIDERMPQIEKMFSSLADVFLMITKTMMKMVPFIERFAVVMRNLVSYIAEAPLGVTGFAVALKVLIPSLYGAQKGTLSLASGVNLLGKTVKNIMKGGLFMLFVEGLYQIWKFINVAAAAAQEFAHQRKVEEARKELEEAEANRDKAKGNKGLSAAEQRRLEELRTQRDLWIKGASAFGGAYNGAGFSAQDELSNLERRLADAGDVASANKIVEQRRAKLNKLQAQGSGVNLEELEKKFGTKSIILDTFRDLDITKENADAEKWINDIMKDAQKETKVSMYQDFSKTNITQNVSLAADIQKVGILLNQNIRALIEKQMRQNREVSLSSNL